MKGQSVENAINPDLYSPRMGKIADGLTFDTMIHAEVTDGQQFH